MKRLAVLDTCVVSDALDHLGISGAVVGVRPMWGRPKVVGRARTVEVVDAAAVGPGETTPPRPPAGQPGGGGVHGRHLATSAIISSGPEDVIVIANNGRTGVSCWGDILTVAAQQRGIRGTVIDGACRDVDAIADAGYPVWARAGVPVTARGRIAERATDVPVSFGGIWVLPGDLVIADGSGVVFVPAARADEVLAAAERLADRQERMVEAVRAGRSVVDVMHDTQFTSALKGDKR
ncbi:MAG TPA: RraA family protein [Trebonia sp.]